jgi:hypothetical protein
MQVVILAQGLEIRGIIGATRPAGFDMIRFELPAASALGEAGASAVLAAFVAGEDVVAGLLRDGGVFWCHVRFYCHGGSGLGFFVCPSFGLFLLRSFSFCRRLRGSLRNLFIGEDDLKDHLSLSLSFSAKVFTRLSNCSSVSFLSWIIPKSFRALVFIYRFLLELKI